MPELNPEFAHLAQQHILQHLVPLILLGHVIHFDLELRFRHDYHMLFLKPKFLSFIYHYIFFSTDTIRIIPKSPLCLRKRSNLHPYGKPSLRTVLALHLLILRFLYLFRCWSIVFNRNAIYGFVSVLKHVLDHGNHPLAGTKTQQFSLVPVL